MHELKGKTAFITGGAGGIGFAIAQALTDAGMRIAITDIDQDALNAALDRLEAGGARTVGLRLDVTDLAAFEAAVDRAERELGPVEVLCSNAGVVDGSAAGGSMEDIAPDNWNWAMTVNVRGAFNALHVLLPRMKARDSQSHILVTGSVAGMMPQPGAPMSYVVSKFALRGMCEQLWTELARFPQIALTLLSPGIVNTAFGSNSARLAPGGLSSQPAPAIGGSEQMNAYLAGRMDAQAIGRRAREAIEAGERYVFTHPEYRVRLAAYQAAILESFGRAAQEGRPDFTTA